MVVVEVVAMVGLVQEVGEGSVAVGVMLPTTCWAS